MSDVKFGQLIDGQAQRDAVHVAVTPVIASHILAPGEHVGFTDDDTEHVGRVTATIGIIDPYLRRAVMPGQRCYLFLYPDTVTGMRHHWSHPAFGDAPVEAVSKGASEKFLREYADIAGVSYDALIQAGLRFMDDDETHRLNSDLPNELFEKAEEMWRHFHFITGRAVGAADRERIPFHCSC